MTTVTERIVDNDLCCGCGVCAALCPTSHLTMDWNDKGELSPHGHTDCTASECKLCLALCPFAEHLPPDDQNTIADQLFLHVPGIQHSPDLGYHLRAYVGYSSINGHREQGASGGLVTWLLESLMAAGLIHGAISVIPKSHDKSDRLFDYAVLRDVTGIRSAASSKYYPVELSLALREVLAEPEDRAYALRLAMAKVPKLRRRIKYILGLTCGQLPNRYYSEYCAAIAGVIPQRLQAINFRAKAGTERAGNFHFVAADSSGQQAAPVPYVPFQSHLWSNYYFTHRACWFCDDVFAETADIVFMDAWLPQYEPDPRGYSLWVTRNPALDAWFSASSLGGAECERGPIGPRETSGPSGITAQAAGNGTLRLEPLPITDVLLSQSGVIYKKRRLIAARVHHAQAAGRWVPPRRIPASKLLYWLRRGNILLHETIMNESKRAWASARPQADVCTFQATMRPYERRLAARAWRSRLLTFMRRPLRLIAKTARRLLGTRNL